MDRHLLNLLLISPLQIQGALYTFPNMPQFSGTGKTKSRDGRQSRSRNTTPSSNISIPISTNTSSQTAYLEIDLGKIMVPTNVTYEHLLGQYGGGQGIPDPSSLNQMVDNLKMLGQLATERAAACDGGMRELVNRRKQRVEEEQQLEQENRNREEKASLKRAAEEEEARGRKTLKLKKVKKERSSVREERPLAVGAHGLARQDGLDFPQGKHCRYITINFAVLSLFMSCTIVDLLLAC